MADTSEVKPESERHESPESDHSKDVEKGEIDVNEIKGRPPNPQRKTSLTVSKSGRYAEDRRRIITEDECWNKLGYTWPSWKKWMLLSSIFAVQMSMNFNTSVYPNAVKPLSKYWGISEQMARVGQMIFLVLYAFGCELWAPWSEEFGRWPILQ